MVCHVPVLILCLLYYCQGGWIINISGIAAKTSVLPFIWTWAVRLGGGRGDCRWCRKKSSGPVAKSCNRIEFWRNLMSRCFGQSRSRKTPTGRRTLILFSFVVQWQLAAFRCHLLDFGGLKFTTWCHTIYVTLPRRPHFAAFLCFYIIHSWIIFLFICLDEHTPLEVMK